MIEPHISSLHKRDDYSFEYFTDEPKINLQSTDPDINPLFLSFLLSLIVLVLLVCISAANKLLEIEREKEYDPKEDITFPAFGIIPQADVKQKGLWTVKDFTMNNTNSLLGSPTVPEKNNNPNIEEYNRLKQQLESAPDSYRESFMSTSTAPYAKHRESRMVSLDRITVRTSLESSYGEAFRSNTRKSIQEISTDTVNSDHKTLDTTIDYMTSIRSSMSDEEIEQPREPVNSFMHVEPPVNKRKSVIPIARMSRFSVMTTDSLL